MQPVPTLDPEILQFSHPNVKVLLLPLISTLVLQPMDKVVILLHSHVIKLDSGAFDNLKNSICRVINVCVKI
jgi:hypothetical protein